MRIMQLVPEFDGGGAERVALSLLGALATTGTPVLGVGFYAPRRPVPPSLEHALQFCKFLGKHPGPDLRMYIRLREVVRTFQPDVIHCHLHVMKYIWPVLLNRRTVGCVYTAHSIASHDAQGLTWLGNLLAFRVARVAVVGVAKAVAESINQSYHITNCRVIANGVDVAESTLSPGQWRERHGISPGALMFLCVGSLGPPKCPGRVLQAFAEMHPTELNAELVFVGDGPLRPTLARMAVELGVARQVHLLGFQPDAADALRASNVLVHCSDLEGDPMAIKEAMCTGLPVIAASVGGVPEVISHGITGYLYPAGDHQQLTALMRHLATNEGDRHRIGAAARTHALSGFTLNHMAAEYMRLYQELAS